MKRARVMMMIHDFRPGPVGGAEIQAERLARSLVGIGHSIDILTSRIDRNDPRIANYDTLAHLAPELEIFASDGANGATGRIHRPPFKLPYQVRRGFVEPFRFLIGKRGSYDLIHCQMAYGHAVVAIIAARLLRRPCIVKIACAGEFGDLRNFEKIPGFVGALRILHLADAVVAISREVEEELLAYGFPAERILRIPNGVDTDQFLPSAEPPISERVRFLLVGRRQRQKGIDILLGAARILKDEGMGDRFEIRLCGADSTEVDYRVLAAEMGVSELTNFQEFTKDPRPVYRDAHCFVLPSRGEGLSNALLEAMASGLPVVASAVSGMPDVVRDGNEGLLVAPESPEKLAAAMKRMILDPAWRAEFGRQARRRVEDSFSLGSVARSYSELYARLCR